MMLSSPIHLAASALLIFAIALPVQAQGGRTGAASEVIRHANQLDLDGKGSAARQLFQTAIDSAATPSAKASAQRGMAMSWAFEGNCKKTGEYEQMVIDYWVTREKEDPHSSFYQQGEMADEAARVCIDSGNLDQAEKWYKTGHDLGLKEPDISPDRKALWEYRWHHAQARIASRRKNRADAERYVEAAQADLAAMTELKKQQETFFPYLTGYVAFYFGDYSKALADLQKANPADPFILCLLGETYEALGQKDKAMECYRKALANNAHNPPAAFAHPFARKRLG